jgi:hypothetical protein
MVDLFCFGRVLVRVEKNRGEERSEEVGVGQTGREEIRPDGARWDHACHGLKNYWNS